MKTVSKRLFTIILALVMVISAVVPSYALNNNNWSSYFETADVKAGLVMFTGSDESERNFTWYYAEEAVPTVTVTDIANNSFVFTGTATKTYSGDYSMRVTVEDLEPGKTYFYRCESGEYTSALYSFTTDYDNDFSAVYVTDIHISYDADNADGIKNSAYNFNETLEAAVKKDSDIQLVLSTGDQASEGLQSEYIGLSSPYLLKSIPIATTVGNHDRKGVDYLTYANLPNVDENPMVSSYVGSDYWFVKGDALFLVLDSNNASGVDHRRFVKEAVEANPNVKWRVAMMHHDLYSGRIPHRESENGLLRTLWAPIMDEFKIDLVLLGHSHYYTVSNVMYNNKTVADIEPNGAVTDPNGTVYMVSGSLNRPRDDSDIGLSDNIGVEYLTQEKIYNILDFSGDTLTVKSYTVESDCLINTLTINKTDNDGGHPAKTPPFYNAIVRFLGTVYAVFNNIGVYNSLKEDGYVLNFFEIVFGK